MTVNVIIREFKPDTDEAFIYSSWRNSSYYMAVTEKPGTPKMVFRKLSHQIKEILKHAKVRIACAEDDMRVIFGYCVYTKDHLNWIYVKEEFREKGIGNLLMPKTISTVTNDLTKIGKIIAEKKNLKVKGEEYESGNYH